jgi:hypothetical protein
MHYRLQSNQTPSYNSTIFVCRLRDGNGIEDVETPPFSLHQNISGRECVGYKQVVQGGYPYLHHTAFVERQNLSVKVVDADVMQIHSNKLNNIR